MGKKTILKRHLKLFIFLQWQIQDFPEGGGGRRPLSVIWQLIGNIFFQKLHKNERNWTERGRASLAPHFGSAND